MSNKVKVALLWLKGLLEREQVEFQIVGGLAATIHGGCRDIADIDLYIHNDNISKLYPYLAPFISKPLGHYVEYGWDLEYCQLVYQGQKIEIGLSQNTRIQSHQDASWHPLEIHFYESVYKDYQGIILPVMPVHRLIDYKRILGREVDRLDIQDLTKQSAS
ncbi:MazG-related protein [Marinomonas sp. THO17]|uniref:MazG-related protein n=1 Tax=Marinomonas sp. THO17 TaxID=3149048 RepID=UPI00336C0579